MISLSLPAGWDLASAARQVAEFSGRTVYELMERRSARKAEAELFELDDRMLRDIGLHRSEVPSVAFIRTDPTRIAR